MKTENTKFKNQKVNKRPHKISAYIKDAFQIALLQQPLEKVLNQLEFKKEILIFIGLTLVQVAISFITTYMLTPQTKLPKLFIGGLDATFGTIIFSYLLLVTFCLLYYLFSVFEIHLFSRILGGKGEVTKSLATIAKISNATMITYLLPLQILPLIIPILATITQIVPIVLITSIIQLLILAVVFLITVFLTIKAIKIIYKLNTLKAILAGLVLPLALEIIILIILAIIFVAIWIKVQGF